MKIGIIGFGQLGKFAAKHLKEKFEVFVADKFDKTKEAEEIGVEFVSLEEAASKEIIIIAVPIGVFEKTLIKIKDFFKPGALLLDVCSVKVKPAEAMKRLVRKDVEIIATHPLFGPQSGADGIEGLKIVLCPVRTTRLEEVKKFLEDIGLKVIVATPEKHDKEMAKRAVLSHFIGRVLVEMKIEEGEITEPSFGKLIELRDMLKHDSWELVRDIQLNNPFGEEVREKFVKEVLRLKERLEE